MQTNNEVVSVFILFPALHVVVMNYSDGKTPVTEILTLTFMVVCLILYTIWHSLHTSDPAGNKIATITSAYTALLVNSSPNTVGLHQK
jgi:hypothetical protein